MTKYQLLRSNKQSGPYTAEELKTMGLKPFDLIWVEGKSFAWLYPSEIDELKEIAPAVDVPVAAKVNTVAEAPASPAPLETISTAHVYAIKPRENESRVQTISIPSGEPPTRDPAPRIIVEEEHLPVGESNNNEIKAEDKAADVPKEEKKGEVKELYIVHPQRKGEDAKPEDSAKPKDQQADVRRPEPVQAEKKFSDRFRAVEEKRLEVKEMFPARPRRRRDLTDTLMFGFLAIALLVTGYLIGRYYSTTKDKNAQTADSPAQQQAAPVETPKEEVNDASQAQLNSESVTPAKPKPVVRQAKKEKKTEEAVAAAAEQQTKKDNAAAEDQKQKEVADKEQAKASARATVYQDVRVKANDYKKVFLGGISDLKITVNNGSRFVLDDVVVEVSYLKNNKEVFKTESLHFQSLLPGAEATVVAPDSKRGTAVSYRVQSVKSKDLGM